MHVQSKRQPSHGAAIFALAGILIAATLPLTACGTSPPEEVARTEPKPKPVVKKPRPAPTTEMHGEAPPPPSSALRP